MKTGAQLLAEAKARIREMPLAEAKALFEQRAPVVFLDIREPNEWNLGRIPDAIFSPRGRLESDVETLVFAVPNPIDGAAGTVIQLAQHPDLPRRLRVISGIRRDEAEELLAGTASPA